MQTIFIILMLISMAIVLAVLVIGMFAMAKGGEFNKKYGNRMMQARVAFQGIAIAFFALAVLTG